jgi:acyl-CoA reductase-like NAD-dependent aldehyde dehydrogenase
MKTIVTKRRLTRLPKEKTDSFKEKNTLSTGSSFNLQHEISDRVRSKRLGEMTAPPSIPHPNREQALTKARLSAGFPNMVNGQRIDSSRTIKISDPVTGEELASVTDTQKDGLDQAVQAAKAAFPLWSSKTWNERRDLLANAMEELKAHTDELCTILIAENGRPYGMAQFEVTWILETYAPALLRMELPNSTWNETGVGQITKRYVPLGVVAAISPWNLPFLLSFTKVLPALLAGNTVVLKPAVFTPLTVLRAADYIREILPPGVLNVISGGDDLGPWMTSHPGFQKVSFTGSSETGRKVFASAAPTLKHLTLELGGNDPGIVLPDADPHAIAENLFRSMFALSGQGCVTLKRLFVHESIYQDLTEALISCAQNQKLGDGFDPETTLGPIQNRPQFARMQTTWEEIQEAKAPILYQGEVPSEGAGLFFPVTLLDNPPAEAAYVIQENFGPLRAVIKYKDLDEAVRLANGTSYGLGASVWGTDPELLDAVARRLDAGMVWINQHLNLHPNVPFSGHKNSGIGIEFGEDGLKEFCNVQVIANRR